MPRDKEILMREAVTEDLLKFQQAALDGDLEKIKSLLENSIDINALDENGFSALHFAVQENHIQVVKYLLEKGASVDSSSLEDPGEFSGWTPLHLACLFGYLEIVKLLLENGADVNFTTAQGEIEGGEAKGWTALHCACAKNHIEIVKLLLEKNARLNLTDNDNRTPLHIAYIFGHQNIMKILIEKGALLKIKDKFGNIPSLSPAFFKTSKRHEEESESKKAKISVGL